MSSDELYMTRCIELARLGVGSVAPNPMVGAVLVHNDRVIGEGYHQNYGHAHAEVNCINSVLPQDRPLIPSSTLYVSLEPCAHFGKTPPCADLIIREKIPIVVIGCRDPFKEVDGKGIEKLKAAGVKLVYPVLEEACRLLNERFFAFHQQQRPYIILKWAQSGNAMIGISGEGGTRISNDLSNRVVHQWRSEEASILIGTRTAQLDNPALTTRLWPGKNPVRLVLDMDLKLSSGLQVFDGLVPTIIFNSRKDDASSNLRYYKCDKEQALIPQLCRALQQLNIQSVLVEGGAKLLQSFIDSKIYDEIRVITNRDSIISNGVASPQFPEVKLVDSVQLANDLIQFYRPAN